MNSSTLADIILCIHFVYVICVVAPVPIIIIGGFLGWNFVRNAWFRLIHLALIGFVVIFAVAGKLCPLTVWEQNYRRDAENGAYSGSFIGNWLSRILYYEIDLWIFSVIYVLFGAFVLSLLYFFPCHHSSSNQDRPDSPQ
ncbi:MAG: DUF2784 domain-containing protein [Candidatus Omnitrophica bacterium]|jgi:polyferredoxin|nr:DUF2784 domain-containing protein [Candidatus Omnitrophota bacterium]